MGTGESSKEYGGGGRAMPVDVIEEEGWVGRNI
jgi:hypothetical protein